MNCAVLRCSNDATVPEILMDQPLIETAVCANHHEWMQSHHWNWLNDESGQIVIYVGDDTPWRIEDFELMTDGAGDSGPGSTLSFHLVRDGDRRLISVWLTPSDVANLRIPLQMAGGEP